HLTADLDQRAISLLLLRHHLVIGDLGVTAKGGRIGHLGFPSQGGLAAYPATAAPDLSTREGREVRSATLCLRQRTRRKNLRGATRLVLRVIHTIHQAMAHHRSYQIPLHRRKPVPTAKVDPGLRRESARRGRRAAST